MKLILQNIETKVAEELTKDDAFEMWMMCDFENKFKAAVAAFYSKKDIQKGDEYLYIEFTDDVAGDTSFLNCSKLMHETMLHFNLYPPIILNTFQL